MGKQEEKDIQITHTLIKMSFVVRLHSHILRNWYRLRSDSADFKIIGDRPRHCYCISCKPTSVVGYFAKSGASTISHCNRKNPPRWQTVDCIHVAPATRLRSHPNSGQMLAIADSSRSPQMVRLGATFCKTTNRHHHICKATTEH